MSPRAFVFSVWVANNKSATATVAALEQIAANNFTVQKEGGRVLVSASMGGKSYSYSVPPDQTASTVAEIAFYSWKEIHTLNSEELELWLKRAVNKTAIMAFNFPLQ